MLRRGAHSRFSSHPSIALPDLEPWAYGNVFYHRAKAMLGSMLSVPSREAVLGFVLLAHLAFANGMPPYHHPPSYTPQHPESTHTQTSSRKSGC